MKSAIEQIGASLKTFLGKECRRRQYTTSTQCKKGRHDAAQEGFQTCPTLMIVAGGTGGHVFPGLAVARQMEARGWRVVWLGNRAGMEATLVPKHGIAMEFIQFGGVRGKSVLTKLKLPFNLLRAGWQSFLALARIRPDVVLGMGGYLTVPAGIMAVLRGCPLVLHEQNSIAGLANRVLSKIASQTLVAFPDTMPRAICTGNPIRQEFAALPPPQARYAQRRGPLRILVVGGSLGAAALNEVVPRALALLPISQRPHVMHQAGAKQLAQLQANYQAAGLSVVNRAVSAAADETAQAAVDQNLVKQDLANDAKDEARIELVPFIDDMACAYAQADLLISRGGAMSVAEIAAAGIAAVLVPFPYAVDDHQTTNAAFLVKHEAAVMMQQADLSAEKLANWLQQQTRETLLAMAQRARSQALPDAAECVAKICASLVKNAPSLKEKYETRR